MKSLRTWAIVATTATLLLISVGGFVRASGSGLGCPDWPHCFGRWIPPTDASQIPPSYDRSQINLTKTWIEYVNRLVGVSIGFLIFGTWVQAFRIRKESPRTLWAATAALLLTAFQGWQGGQVVKHELDPRIVTVHLFLAVAIIFLLMSVVADAVRGGAPKALTPHLGTRMWLLNGALALAVVQVSVGALVRGGIDLVVQEHAGLDRGEWLARVGPIDLIHRQIAILVLAGTIAVAWTFRRHEGVWPRRVAAMVVVIVLAQIGSGLALAYGSLPPWAQVVHVTGGVWLAGLLFLMRLLSSAAIRPKGA